MAALGNSRNCGPKPPLAKATLRETFGRGLSEIDCAADCSIQEYTFSTRKNFLTPPGKVVEKRASARLKHDWTRPDSAWFVYPAVTSDRATLWRQHANEDSQVCNCGSRRC